MKNYFTVLFIFLGFGLITFIVSNTQTLEIKKSDINLVSLDLQELFNDN